MIAEYPHGRGRVAGKVALVTGAARGQGRSHAVQLAREGADVIAIDYCADIATNDYPLARPDDLAETARLVTAAGRRVFTAVADVRERAHLIDVISRGADDLNGLDVVVAQAGIAPLGAVDHQAFLDAVSVNLGGVINAIDASFKHLADGSSIIVTGSLGAFLPNSVDTNGPGGAGYGCSKRAIAALVNDLALAVADRKIRVNAVHPTNVNTDMLNSEPMYKTFRPDLENPTRADALKAFPALQAMPIPFVEPEDVSAAVVFLASDESRYVTGMQMRVDGGGMVKYHAYRNP